MQQEQRPYGLCSRLASQLRPEVPRYDDAPGDETEPDNVDSEQRGRRHYQPHSCWIRIRALSGPGFAGTSSKRTVAAAAVESPGLRKMIKIIFCPHLRRCLKAGGTRTGWPVR